MIAIKTHLRGSGLRYLIISVTTKNLISDLALPKSDLNLQSKHSKSNSKIDSEKR